MPPFQNGTLKQSMPATRIHARQPKDTVSATDEFAEKECCGFYNQVNNLGLAKDSSQRHKIVGDLLVFADDVDLACEPESEVLFGVTVPPHLYDPSVADMSPRPAEQSPAVLVFWC